MRFFSRGDKSKAGKDGTKSQPAIETPVPEALSQDQLKTEWESLSSMIDGEAQKAEAAIQEAAIQEAAIQSEAVLSDDGDTRPFVGENLTEYREPDFTATLPESADRLDVTPVAAITAMRPEPAPTKFSTQENSDLQMKSSSLNVEHVPVAPAQARPGRADFSNLRLDVARISSDIQSGEELYRRAQRRIQNLTSFVEKAELDFSTLNRLEPENRRLKAQMRTLRGEVDEKSRKLDVVAADLEDHRNRLTERTGQYEQAQAKLTAAQKSLQEYERALRAARDTAESNAISAERGQNSLDVERRENEVLRNKIGDLTVMIDEKQIGYVEAQKIADSLAADCADYRQQAESAQGELIEMRNALDAAQKQNNLMKGEMVTLHEDIRTFKTEYEFNVISREDELTALQQQVDTLNKQLEIKDEIVRNAARDVTELRKMRVSQDLEREKLEAQIETQAFQLEEARSEVRRSQQDATEFDRRYRDVAAALSVAQARRMSNEPAETPDISPLENSPADDLMPLTSEEANLSESDIADRITDYKLGLRGNL